MKIIAFIMAFLVLALSAMPCADAGNDTKAKTILTKSNQQKDNSQQDDCSPFCHCTCCAGFSLNYFVATINFRFPLISKVATAYLPAKTNNVALPVWEPPKLSACIIA